MSGKALRGKSIYAVVASNDQKSLLLRRIGERYFLEYCVYLLDSDSVESKTVFSQLFEDPYWHKLTYKAKVDHDLEVVYVQDDVRVPRAIYKFPNEKPEFALFARTKPESIVDVEPVVRWNAPVRNALHGFSYDQDELICVDEQGGVRTCKIADPVMEWSQLGVQIDRKYLATVDRLDEQRVVGIAYRPAPGNQDSTSAWNRLFVYDLRTQAYVVDFRWGPDEEQNQIYYHRSTKRTDDIATWSQGIIGSFRSRCKDGVVALVDNKTDLDVAFAPGYGTSIVAASAPRLFIANDKEVSAYKVETWAMSRHRTFEF